jgi:hypothetical protein
MGTKCASLLAGLVLYSYEADFVQKLLWDENKKNLPCPSTILIDIPMMSYQSTIIVFLIMPV